MNIRPSTGADREAIARVHLDAFGAGEGPVIADLVTDMMQDETAKPMVSLVAEVGSGLAGHVLFTAVSLDGPRESPVASILAPLGVVQASQRQGLGSRLVDRGLEILMDGGVDLVFVLGHPDYYPRFGFQPAGALGFDAPYPIAEKNAAAWMVRALTPGATDRFAGTVRCAAVLDRPEHWQE